MWLFNENKNKNKWLKECVSNSTAVQRMCRNNQAEAKGSLCSAVEKCEQIFSFYQNNFDKTKIHSPSCVITIIIYV